MPPSCWEALAAGNILLLVWEHTPPSLSPYPRRTAPSLLGEELSLSPEIGAFADLKYM